MAETYFLTKTTVEPNQLVAVSGAVALEQFEALRHFLVARVGRDAADLFAEPVLSRGNGASATTISWYVTRAGQGARLADMSTESRQSAEAMLKRQLAAIAEALADPDFGPLLSAALYVDSSRDVWVVDGRPFLVNWGVAPAESLTSQSTRDRHFAGTLGAFLPLALAPALTQDEWATRGYGRAAAASSGSSLAAADAATTPVAAAIPSATPAAAATTAASTDPLADTTVIAYEVGRWRWVAPIILLILFAAILIWLLWPGTLLYPPKPAASVINDSAVAEAARAGNQALEQRIGQLRAAISGAI